MKAAKASPDNLVAPLDRLGLASADLANFQILPLIRRARDFHAYCFSGKRYLDLYRADGFSLLGYSLPSFSLGIKNRVSQALWQGYPHPLHKQVLHALGQCFPNHQAILCLDRFQLQCVLELLGIPGNRPLFPQAADLTGTLDKSTPDFWFPWTGPPKPISLALIPTLGEQGPFVLLLSKTLSTTMTPQLPTIQTLGNQVPVFAVAALITGLSVLQGLGAFLSFGAEQKTLTKPELGSASHPRTKGLIQQLGAWQETSWQSLKTAGWKRRGPYLLHDFSPREYTQIFSYGLEKGIILNPRSAGVNFLPGTMSDGEQKLLESVLDFQPRGD